MQNEAKCPQSRIAQDMYIHIFLQSVNLVFNMNRKKCREEKNHFKCELQSRDQFTFNRIECTE